MTVGPSGQTLSLASCAPEVQRISCRSVEEPARVDVDIGAFAGPLHKFDVGVDPAPRPSPCGLRRDNGVQLIDVIHDDGRVVNIDTPSPLRS
jgi:hypothetical protein